MTQREARCLFANLIAELILMATELGFEIALDEGMNHQGTGHKLRSLHYVGLAQDVLLYRSGVYLTDTADYKKLGEFWKSLNPLCRWGGDFVHRDGNHFSIEWDGRQ